jgi:two-component system response regulator AtoC
MPFDDGSPDRNGRQGLQLARAHSAALAPSSEPRLVRPDEGASSDGFRGLGTSPAMKRVQRLVERSAGSDVPVLITGEAGVGKDLVAREIHRGGSRAHKPLVEVNCASLPNDFFDDLLRAGPSSSGQDRSAPSQLETLEGATLFLADVGELSPALQDRLLQLLRRYDAPQNGNGHSRPVDFRLIGATRRDLTQTMGAQSFSEDLYYRINLIHIHVPPLRAHAEDIPGLLQHFMEQYGKGEGWHEGEMPENLLARFRSYQWPGNVRELENAVRRLIALRDPTYVLEELEAQSERYAARPTGAPPNGNGQSVSIPPMPQLDGGHSVDLKELGRRASDVAEREAILEMLRRTMGSKKETAQRLGISYKALLYKIRDFGISGSRPPPRLAEPADDALADTSSTVRPPPG